MSKLCEILVAMRKKAAGSQLHLSFYVYYLRVVCQKGGLNIGEMGELPRIERGVTVTVDNDMIFR